MVMSPNILEVMSFKDVDSSDNNCCLLYFNANIMCSFTKKVSASGGDFVTQTPVFFYVPPIIL